jgi:hypothetical protein
LGAVPAQSSRPFLEFSSLTELQSGATDSSQAWFWSDRWQAMEREADADIFAGKLRRFNDVDGLLSELKRRRRT